MENMAISVAPRSAGLRPASSLLRLGEPRSSDSTSWKFTRLGRCRRRPGPVSPCRSVVRTFEYEYEHEYEYDRDG